MSTFQGLGLILVGIIFGNHVALRMQSMSDQYVDTILTGMQRGIPVSKQHRWMTIYQQWLPYAANAVVFMALLAIAMLQVGKNVDDANVRLLAYVAAGWLGLVAIGSLLRRTIGFFYFASVLRKAKDD